MSAVAPAPPPLSFAEKELVRNRTARRGEASLRAAGLLGLGTSGLALLESSDWRVQVGARAALGRHGAPHAACAQEVRALLRDGETSVRAIARQAALGADEAGDAPESLVRARALLRSDDARLRRGACEAIAGGAWEALAPDVAALLADPEVAGAAAAALRGIGARCAAPALARLLSRAVPGEHAEAQELLAELVGPDAAEDLVASARCEAAPPLPPLQESAEVDSEPASSTCAQAAGTWPAAGPSASSTPAVTRCCTGASRDAPATASSSRPRRRRSGDDAVAASEPAAAADADPATGLLAQFGACSGRARAGAVAALGALPAEVALRHAAALAGRCDDADWEVRLAAVVALGRLGEDASGHTAAIVQNIGDRHSALREACAKTLGLLGARGEAPRVAALLEDPDPDVRRCAAKALGSFGAEAAGALAASRLGHHAEGTRRAAQRVLLDMLAADRSASASLRPHIQRIFAVDDPDARRAAAAVLERLADAPVGGGGEATSMGTCIAALLDDPAEDKRLDAVRRLQTLSRQQPLPQAVLASLAGRFADDSQAVRLAAVEAFVEAAATVSEFEDVLPVLADLLKHKLTTVRRAVVAALDGWEGDAKAPLEASRHAALLGDDSATARCGAVEALAALGALAPEHAEAIYDLRVDQHWCVRRAVARALSRLAGGALPAKSLEDALKILRADSDWRVQRAASEAPPSA